MVLLGILVACLLPVFLVGWGATWLMARIAAGAKTRALTNGWSAAAKTLGATFGPNAAILEGTHDGVSFKVDLFSITVAPSGTIGQSARIPFTRVVANAPGVPATLSITLKKSGVIGAAANALGAQDVVVGQPAFDRAFVAKSNEPALLARMIGPELATLLLTVSSVDFVIQDAVVIATHGGVVTDPNLLVPMIRATVALATSAAAAAATASPAYRG